MWEVAMRRHLVRFLFLFVLIVPVASRPRPVAAQAVRGVVVDDRNLSRVGTATVRVVKGDAPGLGTETDAQGHFLLPLPGAGEYRLEVQRIGYMTTRSQAFRVEKDDTVSVEFRVAPDAVLVDPITVTAHSFRGRNLFEEHRKDWGKGVFLTPTQIDSMHLRAPAEVFRKMKDVNLTWGWGELADGGHGPLPSVRSQQGTGCLLYMVNRVWVRPVPWAKGDWSSYQLGDMLPEDIAAVEVYRSVSEVPKELRRYTNQYRTRVLDGGRFAHQSLFNCGLVVFWTKSAW
jgi:hypothetical protein